MDRPFWRDLDTYIKNSPIFNIEQMNTPLLVAFGDKDGAVDWHQGIEMYNAARLASKPLVMLVYEGENHGLRSRQNGRSRRPSSSHKRTCSQQGSLARH